MYVRSMERYSRCIEGPAVIGKNCEIGPNCYVRKFTAIGDDCRIGHAVEIKNSIIMPGCHIAHLTYVGDSVVGENCNLGAGTITANVRHDGGSVSSMVKGKKVVSGRQKLGAILADQTRAVEDALLDVMYEIPSREDIVRCVVTKETFTQNRQPMLFNAYGQPVFLGRELRSAA